VSATHLPFDTNAYSLIMSTLFCFILLCSYKHILSAEFLSGLIQWEKNQAKRLLAGIGGGGGLECD
jgi:hypothetical protein